MDDDQEEEEGEGRGKGLEDQTMKYRSGLERSNVIALLIGLYYPKRGLNDKISFVRITFD